MASLARRHLAPELSTAALYGVDGGKMFGVLVVRAPDGRIGFLKAFSGQLQQQWDVDGFVPPVFDRVAREATEPRGAACVRALTARVIAARQDPKWAKAREAMAELESRHELEEAGLAELHADRRSARQVDRSRLGSTTPELAFAARLDETEHRALKTRLRAERAPIEDALRAFERRYQRLRRRRVTVSRIVSWQLYDTYAFQNGKGEHRTLRALFAPQAPPSGAGDCAAPKLLVFAQRWSLEPLAAAEFWWGKPPRGGGREEGRFYPACAEKCATLLPFLLAGGFKAGSAIRSESD